MTAILSPVVLPDSLAAGDQWRIGVSLSDYLAADGWTAVLMLRGSVIIDITGAADTDGSWLFVRQAVDTASTDAGTYQGAIRLTKSLEVVTIPTTLLAVTPNFATVQANELLTHEEKAIPLLEAAILRRVTVDMAAYTITSRQATREDLEKMQKMLISYRVVVARLRNGGKLGSYAVRFGRGW